MQFFLDISPLDKALKLMEKVLWTILFSNHLNVELYLQKVLAEKCSVEAFGFNFRYWLDFELNLTA